METKKKTCWHQGMVGRRGSALLPNCPGLIALSNRLLQGVVWYLCPPAAKGNTDARFCLVHARGNTPNTKKETS